MYSAGAASEATRNTWSTYVPAYQSTAGRPSPRDVVTA